jgi:hypothetical protein
MSRIIFQFFEDAAPELLVVQPLKISNGQVKQVPSTDSAQLLTLGLGTAPTTDGLTVTPTATDRKGILIKGISLQTASMLEIQTSLAAVLFKIAADGALTANIPDNTPSALVISEGANVYLSMDTSDSGPEMAIGPSGVKLGFFGATPVVQQSDISALTDSTGGTADNTVAAVSGSGDDATLNNNFADLIDQINKLRDTFRNLGLMA